MSNTDNFFEQAENHSKVKLAVLNEFFSIWKHKVFYNRYNVKDNKLIVIDGFAGPGEYKSGEKGSPLICLNSSFAALQQRKNTNDSNNKKLEISLYFCEKSKENYDSLCDVITQRGLCLLKDKTFYKKYSNLEETLEVGISNKDFSEFFTAFTLKRKEKYEENPCFAFIDPFGYKDITLEKIISFIESGSKTDLILNMMYEHFNRFLTVDNKELNKTHKKFLGASDEEFEILQKQISDTSSYRRMEIITNFYIKKIKEKKLYATKLEIKKDNKVKMILFYITKNLTGFDLFKEIKHKIKITLEEKEQQMHLFGSKSSLNNKLENFLKENYYPCFQFDEVLKIIKEHDVFFEKMYRQVIQDMKKNHKVEVYKNGKIDNRAINHTEIRFVERNKDEQDKNRMDTNNMESNNRLF